MTSLNPTIKVGAVVVPGEDSYANYGDETATNPRTSQQHHGWTPVMLARLSQLGVAPDFVIHHRYAQEPGNESDAGLLAGSGTWANDAAVSTLTERRRRAGSLCFIVQKTRSARLLAGNRGCQRNDRRHRESCLPSARATSIRSARDPLRPDDLFRF